ncbi:nucleoporin Nup186/Nup192/Nup205 [Podospora australis]|uniref:Nucleoporin Nup186/Nup192/Nup205 n=1 Tax=Podospora australis TaxID=1536484 RepID=A0AAN6X0Y0_9PEZI|nr:nucleoporin Nup186/Nup192/Nup205 [Podospora australis]
MSDLRALEGLQALHSELVTVRQHRLEGLQTLEQLLEAHTEAFKKLLDKTPRNQTHRTSLSKDHTVKAPDAEYKVNGDFIAETLKVADDLDLDEFEAGRILLDCVAEGDQEAQSRPLGECGLIRFHQERRYLLDCMRLCIEISDDEDLDENIKAVFESIVEEKIFGVVTGGAPLAPTQKIIPRCMEAMRSVKAMLQTIYERATARQMLEQAKLLRPENETFEFSHQSLVEQHECLAFILHAAVEKQQADANDFKRFLEVLRKVERYDQFLVHLIPVLGAYIAIFGSMDGNQNLPESRELDKAVCKATDNDSWAIPYLGAAVRAWWTAEYSGFFQDETAFDFTGINLDTEFDNRTKIFQDALKEGAFDFIMSVAADCKTEEWQDPSRLGMRQWLQRKSPPLQSEPCVFSHFLQQSLMVHLEVFIDAVITNMPELVRSLKTEEDEQRQLSQAHEQDLDLERFLLIISYAYEDRPDAAMSFFEDMDSALYGFLQWASTKASTPLVSAFCEMLHSLASNEECALAAHTFLLDEGYQSSGKMKRSQSLTWNQILKELEYFTTKLSERPNPSQMQVQRPAKLGADQGETEPESAMMLECYLRLIAKLATESAVARQKLLLDPNAQLVELLFRLACANIPTRLRACVFYALKGLLTDKNANESLGMWQCTDTWLTGGYAPAAERQRGSLLGQQPKVAAELMEAILTEVSTGFEEPNAFIQLLISLVGPFAVSDGLNDTLPFPENLGGTTRAPGIDIYVDYVFHVFSGKGGETLDPAQLRVLRLSCLEFILACLETFNEDLIVLGNETNVEIDKAMSTTDLATYVFLHPFARVMEWMFNDKAITALINTIHQDQDALGRASPNSPLVLGIQRGVQVMIKVLELQDTYLDLVRPVIKVKASDQRRKSPANPALTSFEDGILNHLSLVVDLGKYCNLGHAGLTHACLKLLEKISTSSKIISAWNPEAGRPGHRNKAIVQLERNGDGDIIAASLAAEIAAALDPNLETESENYITKLFILDFLYGTLKATPDQPTIAHLLLGFRCELVGLSVEDGGAFDQQKSLFHSLLNALMDLTVYQEERGMRGYLITLKHKILRIFQILWKSPLSTKLIMDELRATNFLFHMLLKEIQIHPGLTWDDLEANNPEFLLSNASVAYIDYLGARAIIFEYIGKDLCTVSQNRIPSVKRRIFDALSGQITMDESVTVTAPNIFDFFDFLNQDVLMDIPTPEFHFYRELDLTPCTAEDLEAGLQYNTHRVKECIQLKRNEFKDTIATVPQEGLDDIEMEELVLVEYLTYNNRRGQFEATRLKLLKAWANLLLVMFEANDFKGTTKMTFLLQALQAILPSLESLTNDREAYELARVAKVLLYKLDFDDENDTITGAPDTDKIAVGNLVSDKLFQLFQTCLTSIGKWAGNAELRGLYYSICYRYLTGVVDKDSTRSTSLATARIKTLRAIHIQGERLLNVICDDAYGSDTNCQTAAMILLSALAHLSREDDDGEKGQVIEVLNRLNFIGVLVDSLKTILADWLAIITTDPAHTCAADAAEQYVLAKLAFLLQLCQTRPGALYVLQANLFRALEVSGVFAADPEIELNPDNTRALEKHYTLLVALARIISAAVLARGAHNIVQGRKFLTQHRMLIVHTLKRSAGIGTVGNGTRNNGATNGSSKELGTSIFLHGKKNNVETQQKLEERIEELAEAFMLLITATEFLEFEAEQVPVERPRVNTTLFH